MLEQYPDVLTNYDFGNSYENRTIRAVKLSKKQVHILNGSDFVNKTNVKMDLIFLSLGKSNHFH